MNIRPDMTIVCATDFSAPSKRALDTAVEVAKRFGASKLLLLHVDETIERFAAATDAEARFAQEYARLQEEAREATRALAAAATTASGLPVVPEFRTGNAYLEVVRFAEDVKADLIVVGTHGRTGLKRVIMGSVAERVVRHAPCNVLTVKHDGGSPA